MKRLCFILILCSVCSCTPSSYLSQSIECADNNSDKCKNVIIDTSLIFRASGKMYHRSIYRSFCIIPIEKLNEVRVMEYNKAIENERMGVKNENN
jgi:hypothetical protein